MSNSEIIWESKLDDKWDCVVTRTTADSGLLTVSDQDTTILSESVSLAYGASFGPDIDDVDMWQTMCIYAVDNH